MKNLTIQRNMVVMTEAELNRLMSDLDIYEKSSRLSAERIKLLEETLRNTEKELKELRAKQAADELTAESQRLGEYK